MKNSSLTLSSGSILTTKSSSPEETTAFGRALVHELGRGALLTFEGDLGAGKTTLIKGIVSKATGLSPDEVTSPTFVTLNVYEGEVPVYHFDLYRLNSPDEFLAQGFDEYLAGDGICCIEWSERIAPILPKNHIKVRLSHNGETERKIEVTYE